MRDPDRIEPFLTKLGKIWKENCPDWRFGQFLCNVISMDPFYYEEDDFLKMVEDFFKAKGE